MRRWRMVIDDRRERPLPACPLNLFLSYIGKSPDREFGGRIFLCCTTVQGAPCRLRALGRHLGSFSRLRRAAWADGF
jgi:hypothetical protein